MEFSGMTPWDVMVLKSAKPTKLILVRNLREFGPQDGGKQQTQPLPLQFMTRRA